MTEKEMRARIKQLEKALYKIDILVGKVAIKEDRPLPADVSRALNKIWDAINDAGAGRMPYGRVAI